MVKAHFADHLFLSCKGVSRTGILTDADPLEAELKRVMIAQAAASTVLLDGTKLSERGLNAIAPLSDVTDVLTYGVAERDLAVLRSTGVQVASAAGGGR